MHWNTHAGACYSEVGKVENFTTLVEHFQLFLGVAIISEGIHMRNDVGGNLVWVNIFHVLGDLSTSTQYFDLLVELDDALGPTSGDCLVTRSNNTAQAVELVQRAQSHQGNNGGAIGVGNDPFWPVLDRLWVNLGNDQRHLIIHTESR